MLKSSAGVIFCVVVATRLIPGSPAAMKSEKLTKAEIAALDHKYGWDRPLVVQYGLYVERVAFHGDLGESWLTELSTATLRELFALDDEALQDPDENADEPVRAAG